MRFVLPILLAAVVTTAGVPHALCACGCSWIGRSQTRAAAGNRATGCPHCCGQKTQDGDETPPAGPKPCRCGSCDQRVAVVHRSAASGQSSSSDNGWRVVDVPSSLPVVTAESISPRAHGPDFSSLALPVRALPILLGRLLF